MPNILLVGNGRSLLSRPGLGATIDGFDRVVRFNDFRVEGFETCVGHRTDWWARNELPPAGPRPERFERILLRPLVEDPDDYARTAREVVAELAATHPGTPVEVVARDLFLELRERYGFRHAPLTGTLTAAHLLGTHAHLTLCGFDGLSGGPDALRHYYSEGNVVGDWTDYHDPDLDARYLHDQIAAGRLTIL